MRDYSEILSLLFSERNDNELFSCDIQKLQVNQKWKVLCIINVPIKQVF